MKRNIEIRKAERQDVPLLLEFIKGIARYEKMENEVIASGDVLEREMFDEHRAEAVFAVMDGREVGFALFFYNFSTFIGHSGLYLEDLFVWPEERGKGYGKALLLHLVKIAREHHCGRMEWSCLNWNQPSIDFYLSLGAVPMKDLESELDGKFVADVGVLNLVCQFLMEGFLIFVFGHFQRYPCILLFHLSSIFLLRTITIGLQK